MFAAMRFPRTIAPLQARQYSSRLILASRRPSPIWTSTSPFHASASLLSKRRKGFFSSNAILRNPTSDDKKSEPSTQGKRRSTRPSAAPHSLRRVAVEAQRSRDGKIIKKAQLSGQESSKVHWLFLGLHVAYLIVRIGFECDLCSSRVRYCSHQEDSRRFWSQR